jgi:hypothetical protein
MGPLFSFTVSAAAQEVINSRSKLAFKTLIFQKCLMVTGLLFQLIAELFKPIAEWGAGFTTDAFTPDSARCLCRRNRMWCRKSRLRTSRRVKIRYAISTRSRRRRAQHRAMAQHH